MQSSSESIFAPSDAQKGQEKVESETFLFRYGGNVLRQTVKWVRLPAVCDHMTSDSSHSHFLCMDLTYITALLREGFGFEDGTVLQVNALSCCSFHGFWVFALFESRFWFFISAKQKSAKCGDELDAGSRFPHVAVPVSVVVAPAAISQPSALSWVLLQTSEFSPKMCFLMFSDEGRRELIVIVYSSLIHVLI